jgi:hypothetical protein
LEITKKIKKGTKKPKTDELDKIILKKELLEIIQNIKLEYYSG